MNNEELGVIITDGSTPDRLRANYAAIRDMIENMGCLHCRIQTWAQTADQLSYMVLYSTGDNPSIELYQFSNLIHELHGDEAAKLLALADMPEMERNTTQELLKALFAKGTVLQVLGEIREGQNVAISL